MKEIFGDLWETAYIDDAICITTNGTVKKDGCAVMGRGCALEAKENIFGFDRELGTHLKLYGNHVFFFTHHKLFTFPVKHEWHQMANISIIEQSCKELVQLVDTYELERIVLPRPGCGNGKLEWSVVKPVLEKYFDDRFEVITNE